MRIALMTNPYNEISGSFLKNVNFSSFDDLEIDVFTVKMKHHDFGFKKKVKYFFKYIGVVRYLIYLLNTKSKTNVNEIARELNLPVYFTEISEVEGYLGKNNYDLGIVVSLGHILPSKILNLPRLGFYNFHPGSLLENRGPSPIFWSLYYNEDYMTVTMHKMTERIDVGEVIAQKRIKIGCSSEHEMSIKSGKLAAEIFNESLLTLETIRGNVIKQGVYRKRPTVFDHCILFFKRIVRKIKGRLVKNKSQNSK